MSSPEIIAQDLTVAVEKLASQLKARKHENLVLFRKDGEGSDVLWINQLGQWCLSTNQRRNEGSGYILPDVSRIYYVFAVLTDDKVSQINTEKEAKVKTLSPKLGYDEYEAEEFKFYDYYLALKNEYIESRKVSYLQGLLILINCHLK